ncbi:Uncharacterized conserved protein (UCP012943) [Melia azedarach]|uniref:Uncharacterized conserved protein (UCP012943) n=1 Tax=Melia azedarach TaxID=155640 RepID=A0ACC1YVM8_MELAZ|nr:Uncharacterized conserved protein (UCP012943) [Melia azedarach]
MGGGAMNIDLPMIQFCTSSSTSSSPSTSNLNFPVLANHTATLKQSCTASSCSCHSDSCKKLDCVDKTEGKRASGSLDNSVFGSVPSNSEVESAVAALQSFVRGISAGPEFKWLQPVLGGRDPRILLAQGYGGRVYDTIRMLQTDPSVKRLVVSLSSDKAVWDAVMNNELVRKLRESPYPAAENRRRRSSAEVTNLAAEVFRWISDITKAKLTELIEKFQALVDEVFKPLEKENPNPEEENGGDLEEKVRSSLVLSVMILLIVVVARAHRAA